MPTHFTGTNEQRLTRLERGGRRCNGQNHNCTQTAVVEYRMIPADPQTGQAREGAEVITVRACSKHRRQFSDTANYNIVAQRNIPPRQVSRQEIRRGRERQIRMNSLVGCTFLSEADGQPMTIMRVGYDVDDVRITATSGESFLLRDVYQVSLTEDHDEAGLTSADDGADAATTARSVDIPLAVRFSE